jgi:hypothetical protein
MNAPGVNVLRWFERHGAYLLAMVRVPTTDVGSSTIAFDTGRPRFDSG